jgi:hypothetical protein
MRHLRMSRRRMIVASDWAGLARSAVGVEGCCCAPNPHAAIVKRSGADWLSCGSASTA